MTETSPLMSTQNADNVNITGGTVGGTIQLAQAITDTSVDSNRTNPMSAQIIAAPTSASQHVYIGGLFTATWQGTVANTGSSHVPALIGWYQQNSAATNLLGLGIEGKVEILVAGTTTTAHGVESQFLLDNAGSRITNAFGYNAEVVQNAGIITNYAAFRMADMTTSPPPGGGSITNKRFLQNDDNSAQSLISGQVFGPYGYSQAGAYGELSPAPSPGMAAGRAYGTLTPLSMAPLAASANTIYGNWVVVPQRFASNTLNIQITTAAAAGKRCRLGLYQVSGGVPTSLHSIGWTTPFLVDSTGIKSISIAGFNIEAGVYLAAAIFEAATTVLSVVNLNLPWQSGVAPANLSAGASAWDTTITAAFAFTTGAMPATFPTITYVNASNTELFVWLQR